MNEQRLYQILLAPHVSEKTATAAEMEGRTLFRLLRCYQSLKFVKPLKNYSRYSSWRANGNVPGKTKRFGSSRANAPIGKRQLFVWPKVKTSTSWV